MPKHCLGLSVGGGGEGAAVLLQCLHVLAPFSRRAAAASMGCFGSCITGMQKWWSCIAGMQ